MLRKHVALWVIAFLAAAAPAGADQTDPRLDRLFGELQGTGVGEGAEGLGVAAAKVTVVQTQIWRLWRQSGSETVDLLMLDAAEAMQRGMHAQAEAQYSAVVKLAPDFAEGWNGRATLRFLRGRLNGSIRDIVRVLELEPRHFGALAGLGMIYDRMDQPEAALKSFERALLINPHMAQVRKRIEALRKILKDRDI